MKRFMARDKQTKLYYRNTRNDRWVSQEKGQLYKNIAGVKSALKGKIYALVSSLPDCPNRFSNHREFTRFYEERKEKIFEENFEIVEFELVEK